jgi:hypothetical protein
LRPANSCRSSAVRMRASSQPPGRIVIQTSRVNRPNACRRHRFQRYAPLKWRTVLDNVLLQADAFPANGCRGVAADNPSSNRTRMPMVSSSRWCRAHQDHHNALCESVLESSSNRFAPTTRRASATPSDGSTAYSQQELAVSATASAAVPRMRAEEKGHRVCFVGLLKRFGAVMTCAAPLSRISTSPGHSVAKLRAGCLYRSQNAYSVAST